MLWNLSRDKYLTYTYKIFYCILLTAENKTLKKVRIGMGDVFFTFFSFSRPYLRLSKFLPPSLPHQKLEFTFYQPKKPIYTLR